MNFKNLLNELQAEISGDKIPARMIFNDKGNQIEFSKVPHSSEWRKVLGEIIVAVKKYGLQDKFKKGDISTIDIHGTEPRGRVKLQADTGEKYYYDINSKKIIQAK